MDQNTLCIVGGVLLTIWLLYRVATECFGDAAGKAATTAAAQDDEKEKEPMQNFTLAQLQQFNGKDEKTPIYVSLRGWVFDVSANRTMYGPDGSYHMFAGHDVSRNFAIMSFETSDLDVMRWDDLAHAEKEVLDNWYDSFKHAKGYPIVGRVVALPTPRPYTVKELCESLEAPVPPEMAAAPILIGVDGDVFDMSFGGVAHYGPGGSYQVFAGRDASRALAKMSLQVGDVENPRVDDLTNEERKVLADWKARFHKKGYPVVGTVAR